MSEPHISQSHFGPAISASPAVRARFDVDAIDRVRLGENLQQDFPELDQADWDNAMLRLSDPSEMGRSIRGYTENLSFMRASRSARILKRSGAYISRILDDSMPPGYKKLNSWSRGRDIVTVVEASECAVSEIKRVSDERPIGASSVLAHSLKAAAHELIANRVYADQRDEQLALVRSRLGHAVGIAVGTVSGVAGVVDLALCGSNETLGYAGAGAFIVGMPLAVGSLVHGMDNNIFSAKTSGDGALPADFLRESGSEYVHRTQQQWHGVLKGSISN